MTTRPYGQAADRDRRAASISEIEAVAEKLIDLVEEFETAIADGHVPREFAERLSHLRQSTERITDV